MNLFVTSSKNKINQLINSFLYRMGTSQRDDFYKRENNPGPGTYTARPNSASGPRWGYF